MAWRFGFFTLGLALFILGGPAVAGIDQGYSKTEGKQSWGEIFGWTFGGEEIGKAHALIVGISQYRGFRKLDETAGDPERMRTFLLDDAGFDYVHVLTDEKVTRDRLRTLIQDDFRKRVGPNDRFVFYWSGHGIPVEARSRQLGYLPLSGSAEDSIASMLAMRDVRTDHIDAKQALHVLDTCFSGLARLPETQVARRNLTVELLNKPARHLLTATTGAGQTIASREWAGGIFTDAFIAGARGEADRSDDGVVNMLELEDFVRDRVNAKRNFAEWPDEIKPKSYDLQENEGEFFFITAAKKREVARVDQDVAIEHGMPVVLLGPGENPPVNVQCDAEADRLFWETVRDKTESRYFQAYLERVRSGELCGRFASLAEIELDRLTRTPEPAAGPANAPATLPRERVIQIQEMLNELGFDPGTIDGDFGPRTRTAVIEFQRSIDAPATGTITERDEIALAEAFADVRARRLAAAASGNNGGSGSGLGSSAPDKAFRDCPDCPEMVIIPAGSFMMGSPEDEEGRYSDEGPQHRVTIGSPFALGKYEVTRGQFSRFVSTTGHEASDCKIWDGDSWEDSPVNSWRDPGYAQTDDHPVACVSHEDAQAYVTWLKTETKAPYRLPSEAEWEYAARAGATSRFIWGEDADTGCSYANGADQTGRKEQSSWTTMACDDGYYGTAPVGSYRANPFGLHDMTGNLWESLEDNWHDDYKGAPSDESPWVEGNNSARVLRGGSWNSTPRNLRSANRYRKKPVLRSDGNGFRVARTLTP